MQEAVMIVISYVIQFVGLILLVVGFRRTNRNLLLSAALLLWFGAGSSDFVHGFMDSVHAESGPHT
jgi:hypothetical protein